MRKIVLRPQAQADIDDIATYTISQWGNRQARDYIGDLRDAIERLTTSGMRHPEQPAIYPGLRKMRSGHHLVFYLIDQETIDVVRVLHERQDLAARLVE